VTNLLNSRRAIGEGLKTRLDLVTAAVVASALEAGVQVRRMLPASCPSLARF
jgi:hypothetical protein